MAPDFAGRWQALERGEIPAPDASKGLVSVHSYYQPLVNAADDFVHWAQNPSERVYLGFDAIDREMRGIAPSEMCLINGYSHSGKTLFLLQILNANRDKTVVYFCPDEPRQLTLIKLACLRHGIDASILEQQVGDGDREADYLELLNGGGEDVPSKANTIKAFGKRHNIPLLILHQSSRSAGADGRKMTISSGAYGGEQQATHVIGVRRKRFEIESQIREIEERLDRASNTERLLQKLDELRYELRIHTHTLTVNLVKCKRPSSNLLDDIDYEIEQGTGRLTPLVMLPYSMSMAAGNDKRSDNTGPIVVASQLEMANLEDW